MNRLQAVENKIRIFVMQLRVTNLSSLIAYARLNNQPRIVSILNRMSTLDDCPTKAQLEEFYEICAEEYAEENRPVADKSKTRLDNVMLRLKFFITKLQATNMLTMVSHVLQRNQLRICNLLISTTKDVNATDIHGNNLMHILYKHGPYGHWLRHVLEIGVDPDFLDSNGKSTLHMAVESGKLEDVNVLLKYGADIFGMSGDIPTRDLIDDVILDRVEDVKTPIFEAIRRIVEEVYKSVCSRVAEIDEGKIQERNLAVMMVTLERLGKDSKLYNLDQQMIQEFVLKEVRNTYRGGLRNQTSDTRRQMIIDAYKKRSEIPIMAD
jgi:hypothetical protein